jgi:tRNA pseudouridine38-40 synthase
MKRYFIEFSFKGTRYHGWQLQPNAVTVQSVINDSLLKLTGEKIETTGAGRTDSGVHAKSFTAHFDSDHGLFVRHADFIYKINCILPEDIAVQKIFEVKPGSHARYSATSRIYEYSISTVKDPFMLDFSWTFTKPLDMDAMNRMAEKLKEIHDFSSFSKHHSGTRNNICHISHAYWHRQNHLLVFRIQADRFLRNMVRALVGTMIAAGLRKINQVDFRDIVESKNRNNAGTSVPAHGLTLVNVLYPEEIKLLPG